MTVALFGGSGRTGGALVEAALGRGWAVRAPARDPASIPRRPGLEVLHGETTDPQILEAALRGAQAVVCAFGPRPPFADVFCARATEAIVESMRSCGVRRLVCLTGAMIGEIPENVSVPMRLMAGMFRRQLPAIAADRAAQEEAVMRSGLEWVLVKPPRLTDGPRAGRTGHGERLGVGLASRIGRRDLAEFMLDEADEGRYLGRRVYVSG